MTDRPITAPNLNAAPIDATPIHAHPILSPLDQPLPRPANKPLTLGVFDSGFGGLTVLRALLPLLPGARFVYLGDTARLPYGSKSRETIARYAVSSARFLHQQGADLLVIACNTATALALPDIERSLPIPVLGVVAPGAEAAHAANPHASVLVLATPATVQSHAYLAALHALGLNASEMPCPLLVPLVEEGWLGTPDNTPDTTPSQSQTQAAAQASMASVTDQVLRIYLTQALAAAPTPAPDTLLLGCTHYPLLEPAIRRTLAAIGHPLTLIDSASATAHATARLVATHFPAPLANSALTAPPTGTPTSPNCTFYATDSVEKFQRLGSAFLGRPLAQVHLIDLGG
jgi:glutamate racemase